MVFNLAYYAELELGVPGEVYPPCASKQHLIS